MTVPHLYVSQDDLLDLVQYVAEELRGEKLSEEDAESILCEWLMR